MAHLFAAWSRVRRCKQPAAYASRAYGSEEPQVTALSAHAAGMMRVGDSDCGPKGPGRLRRAADGQQLAVVTTGEPAQKPWRIMTADSGIDDR